MQVKIPIFYLQIFDILVLENISFVIIYSFLFVDFTAAFILLSFKSLVHPKYFHCKEWGKDLTFLWEKMFLCVLVNNSVSSTELECYQISTRNWVYFWTLDSAQGINLCLFISSKLFLLPWFYNRCHTLRNLFIFIFVFYYQVVKCFTTDKEKPKWMP